jgi:hypothetical protein
VGVQVLVPIVSDIAVDAVRLFETPATVTLYVPAAAEAVAAKVSKLEPVVGFVPNEPVTPAGNPEADKVTLPVNPPAGVTVIVSFPLPPCGTVNAVAEGASVKLPPPDPAVMTKF